MRTYRSFYSKKLEGEITLDPSEAKHLQVLRLHPGDHLEVVDGKGNLAQAKFLSSDKKETRLQIETCQSIPEEGPKITLAVALIKQPRLEWLIEKGTELGASNFWLFASDHSERKDLSKNHLARLEATAISALKQCKRLVLPEIKLFSSLPKPEGRAFFGDLSPNAPLVSRTNEDTTAYVGPEGGFSPSELKWLDEHAKGVLLGKHILRAETAGLVFVSLLA